MEFWLIFGVLLWFFATDLKYGRIPYARPYKRYVTPLADYHGVKLLCGPRSYSIWKRRMPRLYWLCISLIGLSLMAQLYGKYCELTGQEPMPWIVVFQLIAAVYFVSSIAGRIALWNRRRWHAWHTTNVCHVQTLGLSDEGAKATPPQAK